MKKVSKSKSKKTSSKSANSKTDSNLRKTQVVEASEIVLKDNSVIKSLVDQAIEDRKNLVNSPLLELAKQNHQQALNLVNTVDFSSIFKSINVAQKMAEEIQSTYDTIFAPITNVTKIFEAQQSAIQKLTEGFVLPFQNISKIIDEATKVNLTIPDFDYSYVSERNMSLLATSTRTTTFGPIEFEVTQSITMEVKEVKEGIKDLKNYLIEDNTKKDQQLSEILDYLNSKDSKLYKLKEISYNKTNSILKIDGKEIKIAPDSNQDYLCRFLFKNKVYAKKVWDYDEIAELTGGLFGKEGLNSNESLRNASRHLTDNIAIKAQVPNFLIYNSKTVCVNPKYI